MSQIHRWKQSQKVRIIHIKKTFTLEELMRQLSNQKKQNSKTGVLVPENRNLSAILCAEIKRLNLLVE